MDLHFSTKAEEAATVWQFSYVGKLIGENQWKDSRAVYSSKKQRWVAMTYLSPKYRLFCEELELLTRAKRKTLPAGYYDAVLELSLWKMQDTANYAKPVFDALERAGIYENDRFIRHVSLVRSYHAKGNPDRMTITLVSVPPIELPDFVTGRKK